MDKSLHHPLLMVTPRNSRIQGLSKIMPINKKSRCFLDIEGGALGATHPAKRGGAQKIVEKKTELKTIRFFGGFFGVEFLDSKKRNGWF